MRAAICVQNLAKRYRIRHGDGAAYSTLREEIMHAAAAPIRWLRGQRPPPVEDFWALKDVSFEVQPGEIVGVIGRNGAGKSTLLKILSRITKPTAGRVEMRGRVGSLLEVGTGFHPELSGRENIFLSGAILGMKRTQIVSRFDEIVDFAGIEKFLDTPVKRYSSGMYVRLGFSIAAHLEPDIVLIDEVLAVGDAEFRKRCLGKLNRVAAEGRTVFFVSHDLPAVEAFCNRVILLDQGRCIGQGLPGEIVSLYTKSSAANAERVWSNSEPAPANTTFRLDRVAVCDKDGRPLRTPADPQAPLVVEIDYTNLRDQARIGTTVVLYRLDGQCILSSLNNRDDDWHNRPRAVGSYRSRCHLPAGLFNSGDISVTVLLWADGYSEAVREDDAVRFTVADNPISRGDFYGEISGAVRPALKWETAQKQSSD